MGRGGGQVVSVLAFYSDDPSSNLAEIYSFFCNIVFEKNENKTKRGQGWSISWKNKLWVKYYSFGSENFTHAYLRVSLFSSQKSLFINLILQQKNTNNNNNRINMSKIKSLKIIFSFCICTDDSEKPLAFSCRSNR